MPVTRMVVSRGVVAYILGKALVVQKLDEPNSQRVVNRQSNLVALAISEGGNSVATADDFGKIYILRNLHDLLSR